MLDKQLWKLISEMNEQWKEKSLQLPSKDHLRSSLLQIGRINHINPLETDEVKEFFNQRPLFAVDGSTYTYGGNYPYRISFLRAMAQCLERKLASTEQFVLSHVVSPLNEADEEAVQQYLLLRSENKTLLNEESAFEEWKNKQLATMEIKVAIESIKSTTPKLILFDGGFLRYEAAAPELWEEYKALSLKEEVISIGVIEEIGTNELSKKLKEYSVLHIESLRDREIMYGLLEPGEWFELPHAMLLKRHFYTCFARLSQDPQGIGIDLFTEHLHQLDTIIRLLASFTPKKTRGIPLPIDLVDERVRIRKEEVELLVKQYIDPGFHERLLNPMRMKRQY